jgi:hypothetical protein
MMDNHAKLSFEPPSTDITSGIIPLKMKSFLDIQMHQLTSMMDIHEERLLFEVVV